MIESDLDPVTGNKRFILKPNASLTRRQAWVLLGVMALVMGSVGGLFALTGAWLVLPFSGAEWLLLAYCFRLAMKRSGRREVITISDRQVKVERGIYRPEQTYRFQRAWLGVRLERPTFAGHPSRLRLLRHGRGIEIGRFLVESEREALYRELQRDLQNR
ncbi:MAG TPA: DUF2244 domain-containing protein [Methylococcus sp.]|nr:DUF2244 domain-containing protein [Methylococcus sp.]